MVHKGQCGLAFIVDILDARAHHLGQLLGNLHTTQVHADAVGLHDGSLAIDINDESRQQVALTMHQTVGVVLRIVGHADGDTHPEG